uniref:Coiled-coil domain-containing protein n=1 Tax=Leersia perrieri TaxID=77586 RepID=A0A0D9W860_9ORYZ
MPKKMCPAARKASRVGAPAPKVTEAELARRREEERLRLERESEAAKKRAARTAEEEEYERVVLVANTNRDDSIIEARSVDEAIARMSLVDSEGALPADKHPERRLKASFKAFEEAELPKLKEEKPGLTLNQYKDMIWKLWKKSPDNPLNQTATWVRTSSDVHGLNMLESIGFSANNSKDDAEVHLNVSDIELQYLSSAA